VTRCAKWRLLKDGTSVWWQVQSRNKRSVALDLRQPEAQDIVRKLAAEADVLIENFRPGAMEGWGLGPEVLQAANPGLIMLRISGYGQTGPYRDRPGFGVVAEAMGGLRHLTGEPGRVPVRVGVSIGDTLASLHGVIGILMALHHRHATRRRHPSGLGQVVDVALYEAVFNCMESLLPEYSDVWRGARTLGQCLAGHRAHQRLPLRRRRLRHHRRQRRQHLQAPDVRHRARRPRAGPELADNAGRVGRVAEIDAAIGEWATHRSCRSSARGAGAARCRPGASTPWPTLRPTRITRRAA
jgi:formyl-CoA transferase